MGARDVGLCGAVTAPCVCVPPQVPPRRNGGKGRLATPGTMTPPTTMDVPGQNCGGGESSAHLATAWCTPPRNPAGVRERRNDRNGVRVGST